MLGLDCHIGTMTHLLLVFSLALTFSQNVNAFDMNTVRKYFACPPCNRDICPPVPANCEPVREAGVCACCDVCARHLGDPCGFVEGRCAPGLQCTRSADPHGFYHQMSTNSAVCLPAKQTRKQGTKDVTYEDYREGNEFKRWLR